MQEFSRGKYDSLHPTEAKFVLVQIAPYLFLEKNILYRYKKKNKIFVFSAGTNSGLGLFSKQTLFKQMLVDDD